ncbi:unnamed protein product [Caenorhabditis auriculariae]|uniref:Chitin-binding type-2 domain-containing protein n=1 Tax=Caenorhabditis auriculariae TaxID=2777116 RepID=A0A8S1HGJ4_9PELO|nr:unnamed protein product [Caenorhabditis auriculariae]
MTRGRCSASAARRADSAHFCAFGAGGSSFLISTNRFPFDFTEKRHEKPITNGQETMRTTGNSIFLFICAVFQIALSDVIFTSERCDRVVFGLKIVYGDPSRYKQCGPSGRVWIVPCAPGMTFDPEDRVCKDRTVEVRTVKPMRKIVTPRILTTTASTTSRAEEEFVFSTVRPKRPRPRTRPAANGKGSPRPRVKIRKTTTPRPTTVAYSAEKLTSSESFANPPRPTSAEQFNSRKTTTEAPYRPAFTPPNRFRSTTTPRSVTHATKFRPWPEAQTKPTPEPVGYPETLPPYSGTVHQPLQEETDRATTIQPEYTVKYNGRSMTEQEFLSQLMNIVQHQKAVNEREQREKFEEMQKERLKEEAEDRVRKEQEQLRIEAEERHRKFEMIREQERQREMERIELEKQKELARIRAAEKVEMERRKEEERLELERRREEAERVQKAEMERQKELEEKRQRKLQKAEEERQRQYQLQKEKEERQRQIQLQKAEEERQRQYQLQKAEEERQRQYQHQKEEEERQRLQKAEEEERQKQIQLQKAEEERQRQYQLQKAEEERQHQLELQKAEEERQRQYQLQKAEEERQQQVQLQKAEEERQYQLHQLQLQKAEQDRLLAERAEQQRREMERLERERQEMQQMIERERQHVLGGGETTRGTPIYRPALPEGGYGEVQQRPDVESQMIRFTTAKPEWVTSSNSWKPPNGWENNEIDLEDQNVVASGGPGEPRVLRGCLINGDCPLAYDFDTLCPHPHDHSWYLQCAPMLGRRGRWTERQCPDTLIFVPELARCEKSAMGRPQEPYNPEQRIVIPRLPSETGYVQWQGNRVIDTAPPQTHQPRIYPPAPEQPAPPPAIYNTIDQFPHDLLPQIQMPSPGSNLGVVDFYGRPVDVPTTTASPRDGFYVQPQAPYSQELRTGILNSVHRPSNYENELNSPDNTMPADMDLSRIHPLFPRVQPRFLKMLPRISLKLNDPPANVRSIGTIVKPVIKQIAMDQTEQFLDRLLADHGGRNLTDSIDQLRIEGQMPGEDGYSLKN